MFDWQHEMWDREWMSPRNGDRGRWYLPNEDIFLQTIHTLEHEYHFPLIIGSPSYIGLYTLRNIHLEQGKKIEPLPAYQKYDFQQRAKQMCNWIAWSEWYLGKPGLSPKNKKKRKIAGFDKNGQFLGAAGSVLLGNGGYTEIDVGEYDSFSLEPAFYHYRLTDVSFSQFNGEDLPCPLDRIDGWISMDLLHCCLSLNIDLHVDKGIVWKEGEKYLARWAKELWQHRVNMNKIEDAVIRRNCSGTAKHIPNTMVGRFSHESSAEYYHPDWNRCIVHRSISNLVYTLNKIKREYNLSPVLVSKDALYFATDESDCRTAVPHMLDHQYEQMGWKPIGVCDLTDEIIDSFTQRKVEVTEQCIKKEMKHGAPTTV